MKLFWALQICAVLAAPACAAQTTFPTCNPGMCATSAGAVCVHDGKSMDADRLEAASKLMAALQTDKGSLKYVQEAVSQRRGMIIVTIDTQSRDDPNGLTISNGGRDRHTVLRANTEDLGGFITPLLQQRVADVECRLRRLGVQP